MTWYFENQKVGEEMASFQLSCIIGEAGTANDVKNNDVKNNDALTIEAIISADKDKRTINKVHGNLSDTTIRVIRLVTSSVSKTVEQPLVGEGGNITYHLRYGNSTEEVVLDTKVFRCIRGIEAYQVNYPVKEKFLYYGH